MDATTTIAIAVPSLLVTGGVVAHLIGEANVEAFAKLCLVGASFCLTMHFFG